MRRISVFSAPLTLRSVMLSEQNKPIFTVVRVNDRVTGGLFNDRVIGTVDTAHGDAVGDGNLGHNGMCPPKGESRISAGILPPNLVKHLIAWDQLDLPSINLGDPAFSFFLPRKRRIRPYGLVIIPLAPSARLCNKVSPVPVAPSTRRTDHGLMHTAERLEWRRIADCECEQCCAGRVPDGRGQPRR